MNVTLIYRRKNPLFFSIEKVFRQLQDSWMMPENPDIIIMPKIGLSLFNLFFLKREVKMRDNSVFHITGDIHYAVFALPVTRTILTIHDCGFVHHHNRWKRLILKKILLDWPVKRTKYITTISDTIKNEIVRLTGCKPEKIQVIPNPISKEIYFSPKIFNQEDPVLLFIGSTPNKNIERVAKAIRGIKSTLVIIGKPTKAQRSLLDDLGVNYSVTNGLTDQEIADHYAKADITLFPSLYEGFGLPILESQKAGRSIITSNFDPMKQMAGEGACFVDPYSVDSIREGVLKIIEDGSYRAELIEKGFQNVKKFSVEDIVGMYKNLYDHVIENN